jgi:threonyl-tRNA synthetase
MDKKLDNLRHSASHLLAAAILDLYPNTKPTLGPPIENGFYYDFDFGETKITEAEFPKIEDKMKEIVKDWKNFERIEVDMNKAEETFKNNEYKKELIEEFSKKGEQITLYKSGGFTDLCRGGHINNPSEELKYFKLLSVAGAYWRGDEKNKMLTRIYGTVFPTKKELDEYLNQQEEAKERDHRVIGKNLNLFVFSDLVGKGLPLLTYKGATIKRELERFIIDEEIKRGYKHVVTPHLAKTELYKKSGHYPYYKDTMYPVMKIDEEELILRPMTCPHHFMIYASQLRSYKELPLRIAEMASQFRYEKSGELTGLVRIRTFTLNDAHIFVEPEKVKEEIKNVLDLIEYSNGVLGLVKGKDYRFRLSLGDRKDSKKYYKDDPAWDNAEKVLRDVLTETKAPFYEAIGEAAFYGPKIDVQIKKINEKEETAFTIQYDFVMPKRFDLKYIDEKGHEKQPIVIHRAAIGCIERTMAFLIEKYKGNFPTWLTPVQVKVLPISSRHIEYAKSVVSKLKDALIRVELDDRNATLPGKIRNAQMEKVSYMLIVGDKEEKEGTVSLRERNGKDHGQIKLSEFIKNIKEEIDKKVIKTEN